MPAHSRHAEQGGRPPACGQGEKQAAGGQRAAGLGPRPAGLQANWAPVLLCSFGGRGPGQQGPNLLFQQSRREMGMRLVYTVGTQPRSPAAPVLETVSPLGPSSHLLTQVHCALTVHRLSNDRGPGTGRSHGSREKGPLLEESPGLGIKIALLVGGSLKTLPLTFPNREGKQPAQGHTAPFLTTRP